MNDVIIIGGGVIGLTLACELAGEGASVAILDKSALGQESSWAGAGMLPPGNPHLAQTPEAKLRAASHVLWPSISAQLLEETGIDNEFRLSGGIEVRVGGHEPGDLDKEMARWRSEGVTCEPLDAQSASRHEPELNPGITSAYRLPELGQVRNPRHLQALVSRATLRGVSMLPEVEVYSFATRGGRISGLATSSGTISGGEFVVTSGAWSSRLLKDSGTNIAIRPLRGQIVLLSMPAPVIRHVINVGPRYLVPRGDGRILVGATEENVGYDKRATAAGAGGLIELALTLIPRLSQATLERCWAGLRPQSADGLPYLGRVPNYENLFIAAGHFRAGVQLSPITAKLMSELILGRPLSLPLAPYSASRHSSLPQFEGDSELVH